MNPHVMEHVSEADMMLFAMLVGLIGVFSFAVSLTRGSAQRVSKLLLGLTLTAGMAQGALAISAGAATLEKEAEQFCNKGSHLYNEAECRAHRDMR